jgi:hypothetical protein
LKAGAVGLVGLILLGTSSSSAAPSTWTRIEHDALRGGVNVHYITDLVPADGAGGPWLAVGYVVDSDGTREPSAWTSADGARWRRHVMAPTESPELRDGPFHVARRGNVAVAVGNRFDGRLSSASWWSDAPGVWHAVTDPRDELRSSSDLVEDVIAAPDGFYSVGYYQSTNYTLMTVFRSENGRAWHVQGGFTTPNGERFQPLGMATSGTRMVLVGDTAVASADGRIWVGENGYYKSVDPAPLGLVGPGLQQVADVAWDPALGFVAGGLTMRSNVEVPTMWRSQDGVTWERLPALPTSVAAAVHTVEVAPGGGFVASGNSDAGPRIWRSSNGREWSEVPVPPVASSGGTTVRVAGSGSKIVYSTLSESGSKLYHRQGNEWKRGDTGPAFPASSPYAAALRDVAVAGGRALAIGNDGQGRPLVMISRSPGDWRKVAFPDRAARFSAVTADRGVFTIVGWRLLRGRGRATVWTSRTGTSWRRIGGTAHHAHAVLVDVAPDGRELVALGMEGSPRGLQTTVWTGRRGFWLRTDVLGPGEPQAICAGPHGALAVSMVGIGPRARVHVWSRTRNGEWSPEPETLASGGFASRCADGPRGTVVVGDDESGTALAWLRARPGTPWRPSAIGATNPPTRINDIVRDGSGFLATGTSGSRGQADLGIWTSADGLRWSRIGTTEQAFLEPGYQAGLSIARQRGRVVVAGSQGAGNAGLWIGP